MSESFEADSCKTLPTTWYLDEVIEHNTLQDIYNSWCEELSIKNTKYSIAEWCQLISNQYEYSIQATLSHDSEKNIIGISLKSPAVNSIQNLEPFPQEKVYSISIIHIREKFFYHILRKYQPYTSINSVYDYKSQLAEYCSPIMLDDFIKIKFVLPKYEITRIYTPKVPKIYAPCYDKLNENANASPNTADINYDTPIIEDDGSVKTPVNNYENYKTRDLTHLRPNHRVVGLNERANTNAIEKEKEKENKQKLKIDLINWIIVDENEKTMLVRPNSDSHYSFMPNKISTHGLYHRPIYYWCRNKCHKKKNRDQKTKFGYWINKKSELAHIIKCYNDDYSD